MGAELLWTKNPVGLARSVGRRPPGLWFRSGNHFSTTCCESIAYSSGCPIRFRPADRAEQYRVGLSDARLPVFGHHPAMSGVVIAAGKIMPRLIHGEPKPGRGGFERARMPSGTTSLPIPSPGNNCDDIAVLLVHISPGALRSSDEPGSHSFCSSPATLTSRRSSSGWCPGVRKRVWIR